MLRARVGFRPTRPQQAAGARIEPNPSDACAAGSMRAPTAAAAPPLEPPDMRVWSQGFFVAPCNCGSQVRLRPSSQVLVRPKITMPGAFQPLDELAVFRRHDVFEELAAPRRRAAGEGGAEVLQQIGHAGERPLGEAAGDGLAAMVVELVGDRVDGTVARVDPFDRSLQQFLRSSFAPCNQRGQSDRIMLFIVRKGGHLVSPFGAASRTPAVQEDRLVRPLALVRVPYDSGHLQGRIRPLPASNRHHVAVAISRVKARIGAAG